MKNKQGGFIEAIIIIIAIIIVLSFMHISLSGVVNYIVNAFHNVFG